MNTSDVQTVTITKLVHGGQGIGVLSDGKKVFVWGVLPGETVQVRVVKNKKSYAEAQLISVINASPYRVLPKDDSYMSTSPWQIMNIESENQEKLSITKDAFAFEGIKLPDSTQVMSGENEYRYRNKMEYSFFGDEQGVHLALYNRGTHQKQIVTGSSIAMECIDQVANELCEEMNQLDGIRAGDLKSVILRANQAGEVVVALFTKLESFPLFSISSAKALVVYYSNPKSPASLPTKLLYSSGDTTLSDMLLDKTIYYDVLSFFQVNLPVFELALQEMNNYSQGYPLVDMYSGVGTIGVPLKGTTTLVESDDKNILMAQKNVEGSAIKVVHATSETALEYITNEATLIVDPPRAGLHKDVVERILEVLPPRIMYLSCNPSTQARDMAFLVDRYKIAGSSVYNFFPHTPHIESLLLLELI